MKISLNHSTSYNMYVSPLPDDLPGLHAGAGHPGHQNRQVVLFSTLDRDPKVPFVITSQQYCPGVTQRVEIVFSHGNKVNKLISFQFFICLVITVQKAVK